jgi:uncharacterized membrane protein YeaQ/YmgE (transglycosylase-associated protein family)
LIKLYGRLLNLIKEIKHHKQEEKMNLFALIIVGLISGYLAFKIMKINTSLFTELILGIVGSILGGWLTQMIFGVDLVGAINLTSILFSLNGAINIIVIYRFLCRKKLLANQIVLRPEFIQHTKAD